jgi:hypothetical protein
MAILGVQGKTRAEVSSWILPERLHPSPVTAGRRALSYGSSSLLLVSGEMEEI